MLSPRTRRFHRSGIKVTCVYPGVTKHEAQSNSTRTYELCTPTLVHTAAHVQLRLVFLLKMAMQSVGHYRGSHTDYFKA